MARRRELQRRIRALGEVNDILESMRMLSVLEVRRLTKFVESQQAVIDGIRSAAGDFLASYPEFMPRADPRLPRVLLAIGSERGFCGDFNPAIRAVLERRAAELDLARTEVIAIGHKLASDLDWPEHRARVLDGPTTADDVPPLLLALASELVKRAAEKGPMMLHAIHHGATSGTVIETPVLPAFCDLVPTEKAYRSPLKLYLTPSAFFSDLAEQFLFAQLNAIMSASLLYEHQRRVQHLEGATQRMGENLEALARRQASLRQEEITEELEVILLGTDYDDG